MKPKRNLKNILPPIGFIAHCDVVPVTKEKWDSDPFDPDYSDPKLDKDYVYGRGAMDTKTSLILMLESLQSFLKDNPKNDRTRPIFYIFPDDEEIFNVDASSAVLIRDYIFKTYSPKNQLNFQKFALTLDEGGSVFRYSVVPGYSQLNKPIIHMAYCEKGYINFQITVNATGGHSSMMTMQDNAIVRASQIISALENEKNHGLLKIHTAICQSLS